MEFHLVHPLPAARRRQQQKNESGDATQSPEAGCDEKPSEEETVDGNRSREEMKTSSAMVAPLMVDRGGSGRIKQHHL